MVTAKVAKTNIIEQFREHNGDTGSARVQIALLTSRINQLTDHFRSHARDHHSRQGLLKLVSRRRKLLDYVKDQDERIYQQLVEQLGLRR